MLLFDELLSSTKTFADRRIRIELGVSTPWVRALHIEETTVHLQKERLIAGRCAVLCENFFIRSRTEVVHVLGYQGER